MVDANGSVVVELLNDDARGGVGFGADDALAFVFGVAGGLVG